MIAIADSGATKTDWVFITESGNKIKATTAGFNPYFIDETGIYKEIKDTLPPTVEPACVTKIFFYGAGCSTKKNCDRVLSGLKKYFKKTERLEISHDLLGAARSLFQAEGGLACILGTGSNTCYYNGSGITEDIPSLGFMLADEGSGAYLGKALIREFFIGSLPEHIKINLINRYSLTLEGLLSRIYHKPHPNRYLASFAPFLKQNMNDDFIYKLLHRCFVDFFRWQVSKYNKFPGCRLGAAGSVAYFFQEVLQDVAREYSSEFSIILKDPIDGLITYHSKDI